MSRESDLNQVRDQAREAYQAGRPTFVARLKTSMWGTNAGEMAEWQDSLDAVESTGWTLVHWTVTADAGGVYNAFPLFRRREQWHPQDTR